VTIAEEFDSPRLRMRRCFVGDGVDVHEAETETFDQLRQWFGPWAKDPCTPEQTEERILKSEIDFRDRTELVYNCYLKSEDRLAGRAWFSRTQWSVPKCMFGMWVRSSLQRQGLGLEITAAFTLFGLEQVGFKRIEIYIDPRNEPSLKMFEKVGYIFEGRLRNYSYDNLGVMRDYLVYSVIPSDMKNSKALLLPSLSE
jgi:RimJ/RimL family protein N-acetyltransferase